MTTQIKRTVQLQTNESKVRLVALLVLLLLGVYWWTASVFVPLFLVIDFGLRSFALGRISPLANVSEWLIKSLVLPVKPVYWPPKRFAARIGFTLTAIVLALHLLGVSTVLLSGVIACFAALESLAGICAGCYVFDYLQRFKRTV